MSAGPALRVAGVLAAAAVAVPLIGRWEGFQPVGYRDMAGIPTACYGHTQGAVVGKVYSERACMELLATDVVVHGVAIERCITAPIPPESLAAFVSFAFNAGVAAFCGSTMARKLNARDLAGACAELSRWVNVKGVRVQGLVNRRAEERAFCERGLKGTKT